MMGSGAVLVDVREDDEWAAGHARGATHLPMSRLSRQRTISRGTD
jgi:rhodanese-related sulfurtransferase